MKKLFIIGSLFCLAASFLLVGSCIQDPEADFARPTVTASYSPGANFGEVILTCQVSNSYFKNCGFWYGTTSNLSDKKSLPITAMSGKTGEARLTNLETGRDYYFQAYVDGGLGIVTSGISHFIIDDVMDVDAQGFNLSYPETDIHVKVETSLPITVDLGGANWITETQTKGLDTYNKVFHISANTELEDRAATIRIFTSNGQFNKEIPVLQSGGPITIPDSNFKYYLVAEYDQDGDGEITRKEALDVSIINVPTEEIETLQGVEYFENVEIIQCIGSGPDHKGRLISLDVTNNTKLTSLLCYFNQIESIDLRKNTALERLYCFDNSLTTLDISNNTALTELWCGNNQLTSLNVSNNTALITLECSNNQLTSLNVSDHTALTKLNCSENKFTSINVSNCTALTVLSYHGTWNADSQSYDGTLTSLDASNCTSLTDLSCSGNQLITLDVSDCIALTCLYCSYNQLTTLDVSNNQELTQLVCNGNPLSSLDLSKNTKLTLVSCEYLPLTVLDLSAAPNLKYLYCNSNNTLKAVYVHTGVVFEELGKDYSTVIYYTDGNNHLDITPSSFEVDYKENIIVVNVDSNLDFASDLGEVDWISPTTIPGQGANTIAFKVSRNNEIENRQASFFIRTGNGQLEKEVAVTQTGGPIPIPDANFKSYCVAHFDMDGDSEITRKEALNVTSISVSADEIETLQGIDYFENLTGLSCRGTWNFDSQCSNGKLTNLDVSHNIALTWLFCDNNQLTTLNVSNNTVLNTLDCGYNQLTALDVNNNMALRHLYCRCNRLTELDVSKNAALSTLWCYDNQLTALDVSNNTALSSLWCYDNQLTALDVSNNTALSSLECGRNQLTALDVSKNIALTELSCGSNQLTALDVNNNTALTNLSCYSNQLMALDVNNNTALTNLSCYSNQLMALDVSNNTALTHLHCRGNPNLLEIWLKTGQTIQEFSYDSSVSQIRYKD